MTCNISKKLKKDARPARENAPLKNSKATAAEEGKSMVGVYKQHTTTKSQNACRRRRHFGCFANRTPRSQPWLVNICPFLCISCEDCCTLVSTMVSSQRSLRPPSIVSGDETCLCEGNAPMRSSPDSCVGHPTRLEAWMYL